MSKRIAIVEDEASIRENYVASLRKHGFDVNGYADKASAEKAFKVRLPDLAILDVGLGAEAEGGFDLCRELRSMSKTLPIMFLTALDSDFDVISGLRLGADDYLTKDISLPHLMARVTALLRRAEAFRQTEEKQEILQDGALKMDLQRFTVYWQEQLVELTLTEFWVIHALAKHPGHVKSREQLMQEANVVVDGNTVTSHIKRIRKKFQQLDAEFDAIDAVYGMGYRWQSQA